MRLHEGRSKCYVYHTLYSLLFAAGYISEIGRSQLLGDTPESPSQHGMLLIIYGIICPAFSDFPDALKSNPQLRIL